MLVNLVEFKNENSIRELTEAHKIKSLVFILQHDLKDWVSSSLFKLISFALEYEKESKFSYIKIF